MKSNRAETLALLRASLLQIRVAFADEQKPPRGGLTVKLTTSMRHAKDVTVGLCGLGVLPRKTATQVEDAFVAVCTACLAVHDEQFTGMTALCREARNALDVALASLEYAGLIRVRELVHRSVEVLAGGSDADRVEEARTCIEEAVRESAQARQRGDVSAAQASLVSGAYTRVLATLLAYRDPEMADADALLLEARTALSAALSAVTAEGEKVEA